MKHTPTPEQKAKAEERREKLRVVWEKIGAMSTEEREKLAETMPTVVTCEGHPLTINNTLLLYAQAQKSITVVGGFQQWKKQGRQVRKGESALGIWIPAKPNDKKETQEKPTFFIFGSVFDISQTESAKQSRLYPRKQ